MTDHILETKIPYLSIRYRRLCRKGLIIHDYENDPNVIKKIEIDDDLDELKKLNDDILLTQGEKNHCVIGRGFYRGYLVKMRCRTPVSTQLNNLKNEIKNQFSKKVQNKELIQKLEESIINTDEKLKKGTTKYYLEI